MIREFQILKPLAVINSAECVSVEFNKILGRPIAERRILSDFDMQILKALDFDAEYWTPDKAIKTARLMQVALKRK